MLSSISTLFADLLYEITEHISSVDFLQKKKKIEPILQMHAFLYTVPNLTKIKKKTLISRCLISCRLSI